MRTQRAVATLVAAAVLSAATPSYAQSVPSPDPDPWFGPDKALHFSAGLGLGVGGYAIGAGAIESRWAGVALGIALAAAVGGIKEGIDATGVGDPSLKDWVWDLVGGGLGVGLGVTFDAALRGAER